MCAAEPRAYRVLLLALAFVGVSLACKLVPWFGLGFLDERAFVRSSVAGLLALAATVRGWAFSACVARFGPHPVALGIGTTFGLVHLLNPNVTWMAVVSVAAAGWLIGYVMLASRNIVAAIGIHVGWNVTQSMLTSERLWVVERGSSSLLSGGAYGLEASLPGLVVTFVAAAVAGSVVVARGRSSR